MARPPMARSQEGRGVQQDSTCLAWTSAAPAPAPTPAPAPAPAPYLHLPPGREPLETPGWSAGLGLEEAGSRK